MDKFAIIETGGKQYRVAPGQKLKIEKLLAKDGEKFVFENVLLAVDGEEVTLGTPNVKGGKVEARVLRTAKGDKKIVFRYHSKTRYRKKKGHRQLFTEVEITKV